MTLPFSLLDFVLQIFRELVLEGQNDVCEGGLELVQPVESRGSVPESQAELRADLWGTDDALTVEFEAFTRVAVLELNISLVPEL